MYACSGNFVVKDRSLDRWVNSSNSSFASLKKKLFDQSINDYLALYSSLNATKQVRNVNIDGMQCVLLFSLMFINKTHVELPVTPAKMHACCIAQHLACACVHVFASGVAIFSLAVEHPFPYGRLLAFSKETFLQLNKGQRVLFTFLLPNLDQCNI